jgi:energy-coupling factor transporter ATP-binding protein EcfA2
MDGLSKSVLALFGLPASIYAGTTKFFDSAVTRFGWYPEVSIVAPALIVLAIVLLLLLSFRRFYRSSRLEQPNAFTLRPTDPGSLYGREQDLDGLLKTVKNNRLVLLDGESGCGKSALVSAGLIPSLQSQNGLLPVAIYDWGDDWLRGPLSAALDALYQSFSQADREKLDWTSSPDLAADIESLALDLSTRLIAVVNTLGRRPLLIADQFDDYQARHRNCFLDEKGNWLSPSTLAKTNRFWDLIDDGLSEGRLHLLVITRADTAAGFACVRFLGEDQIGARTLPRVEAEYLRPLLAKIAADDALPPAVSNPAGGWHELRERLEIDLRAESAILMQQVRTVLLGLRQLPLLTPRSYRTAGGLQGLGTLVISRSITRASDAVGGGEAGIRTVRVLLGHLILPGGPNQPPKARRTLLPDLVGVVGDLPRTEAILKVLQHDEIVRSAEAGNHSSAWQLDHDYLARSVLAEARQADRWAISLREFKERYEEAENDWRQRWAALLPVGVLTRVCWERLQRRLEFRDAATYVRISTIRPAIALLCMLLIGAITHVWYQNSVLSLEANRLIENFGTQGEWRAVLRIWRAPDPLRRRVYELLTKSDASEENGSLKRATKSGWPLAHAGFVATEVREITQIYSSLLAKIPDGWAADEIVSAYKNVAVRLTDADAKVAATTLHTLLEHAPDDVSAGAIAKAYATVAVRLTDTDAKIAATAMHALLAQTPAGWSVDALAEAYATVAVQLTDAEAKSAATTLRTLLENALDGISANAIAHAYESVAARLTDTDAKVEFTALRTLLEHAPDGISADAIAQAYVNLALRLTDTDAKITATTLRTLLEHAPESSSAKAIAEAYASVAVRLTDTDTKIAANTLRTLLELAPDGRSAGAIANAYATVVVRLADADAKVAATALRTLVEHVPNGESAGAIAEAYATVVVRLTDADAKVAATALRTLLARAPNGVSFFALRRVHALARAYATVAMRLTDADVKVELTALRALLEHAPDGGSAGAIAQAFGTVAVRLTDADVKAVATALRALLEHAPAGGSAAAIAKAYATVAVRLTDTDIKVVATALHTLLAKTPSGRSAGVIAEAYATVAVRLTDADLKVAGTALRTLLVQKPASGSVGAIAKAYATVAVRLTDADAKIAAATLRTLLEHEPDSWSTDAIVEAYAIVAARLTDADVKIESSTLRTSLEQTRDGANNLAEAYVVLVGIMAKSANPSDRSALVRATLSIAGHPYINDYALLLAALRPLAGTDFEGSIGAALKWAEQNYGIRPDELRPPPLAR